ncbi:MAG: enoyl-CoA hydratase/isomerase family protein, partial [Gemmatimonadetes bacterium]|nr:enoyl-CoA hydratase/isomerase family protein [Gemmatimonadota bacterium]
GSDISEFPALRFGREAALHYNRVEEDALVALADCPLPTVAMIYGYCVGGGIEVAVVCDLRVAGQGARFGATPAKLGIAFSRQNVERLCHIIGPSHAKDLLLTAELISAERAHQIGLVNRVVADEALEAETLALARTIAQTDILIASTSAPHPLVTRDGFRHARKDSQSGPLLILDLAIPRDVEPEVGNEANVFLYNVDHLHEILDDNLLKRRESVPEAEAIVDEYAREFLQWYGARDVVPVIRSLRARWDDVRERELERLWRKLSHLPANDRDVVEAFSKQLLNKLLHDPTKRLKQGIGNGRGVDFIDAVRYLHDLETEEADRSEGSGTGDDEEAEGIGVDVTPAEDQ